MRANALVHNGWAARTRHIRSDKSRLSKLAGVWCARGTAYRVGRSRLSHRESNAADEICNNKRSTPAPHEREVKNIGGERATIDFSVRVNWILPSTHLMGWRLGAGWIIFKFVCADGKSFWLLTGLQKLGRVNYFIFSNLLITSDVFQ